MANSNMHLERLIAGDASRGPALVFVHGWQDDRTAWSGVIAELSSTHRCIAIDLPGHGETVVEGPEDYERDSILAALDSVVGACDAPPVLIGHSLGGFLALSYAITRPGSIAGLGLVATGPGYRSDEPRAAWNAWVRENANADAPPGQETICLQHDALVIDGLGEIDVPTTVIVGERDTQYFAAVAVFERKLADVESVTIGGGGHNVHKRQPDEVAVAIRSLLDRIG